MPHGAGILLAISVATVVAVVVVGGADWLFNWFVGHSLYGALHFYCRVAFGCLIN